MPDLFGVDIKGEIADAFRGELVTATLTKVTPGTRDPANPTQGTSPTTSDFTAEGIIEDYADRNIDGSLVKVGDRKVLLIAGLIASSQVPTPNDRITIEGSQYDVIRVERDPAEATYTCQVRRT